MRATKVVKKTARKGNAKSHGKSGTSGIDSITVESMAAARAIALAWVLVLVLALVAYFI